MKTAKKMLLTAMAIALSAEMSPCLAQSRSSSSSGRKKSAISYGGCCRRVWDVNPRPELNPPDDIATLPDREQQRFVKIFNLVPEPVKVKSTQNYAGRITFMQSKQYASITNKLAQRLARSTKMLAEEPTISAGDVQKMCFDTIVYGRSLIMGRMDDISVTDLARRYGFKNALKFVEKIEDTKYFRRGLKDPYPRDNPECRDFEKFAETLNPHKWKSTLARLDELNMKYARENGISTNGEAVVQSPTKKQMYDEYEITASRSLPQDLENLPNRERLRLSKMYEMLPPQALSYAQKDHPQRIAYLVSSSYATTRQKLLDRLAKDSRRLAADPAVTPDEIAKLSDETIRYGRPLAFGDMRHVSLTELARQYGYKNVEKFVDEIEDEKNSRKGIKTTYPIKDAEFADFAVFARKACPDKLKDFADRISRLNGKTPQRSRR